MEVSCWELTDENRHRLTASADASAGHRCHLHLVEHAGHQGFEDCGQCVSSHCLVDVEGCLVVATSHTPNLVEIHIVGNEIVPQSLSVCGMCL